MMRLTIIIASLCLCRGAVDEFWKDEAIINCSYELFGCYKKIYDILQDSVNSTEKNEEKPWLNIEDYCRELAKDEVIQEREKALACQQTKIDNCSAGSARLKKYLGTTELANYGFLTKLYMIACEPGCENLEMEMENIGKCGLPVNIYNESIYERPCSKLQTQLNCAAMAAGNKCKASNYIVRDALYKPLRTVLVDELKVETCKLVQPNLPLLTKPKPSTKPEPFSGNTLKMSIITWLSILLIGPRL